MEGRIAVEYFDPSSEAQDKKYAFKCHRQTINDVDHVWPVNALAFHPVWVWQASFTLLEGWSSHRYNTFASAGSDGTVSIWDHKLKKRLRQYPKYQAPVPSVAFNCDGTRLAVGVSYNWDEGDEGAKTAERPTVFVRTTGDEVKVCSLWGSMIRWLTNFCTAKGLDGTLMDVFVLTRVPGFPYVWCCDAQPLGIQPSGRPCLRAQTSISWIVSWIPKISFCIDPSCVSLTEVSLMWLEALEAFRGLLCNLTPPSFWKMWGEYRGHCVRPLK